MPSIETPTTESLRKVRPLSTVISERPIREATGELLREMKPVSTLAASLAYHASCRPDKTALSWRDPSSEWNSLTWSEYGTRAAAAAQGLRDMGVRRGDVVALILTNSWEFHVIASGAQLLGSATVSFYANTYGAQLEELWADCGADVLVTDSSDVVDRFSEATRLSMKVVGVGDATAACRDVSLDYLLGYTGDLQALADSVDPGDAIQIVYTSGTTGTPKGVVSSHGAMVRAAHSTMQASGVDLGDTAMVSYLPMAHNAERITTFHLHVYSGAHVVMSASASEVWDALSHAHPAFFFGVPLIWDRIARRAMELEAEGNERNSISETLGIDRLAVGITGAAATPEHVMQFFRDNGVPLSDMFGMTETLSGATWSPYSHRSGSVGRPMPGVTVRIAEDDEILVRPPGSPDGYLHRPVDTAELFSDGFIRTGDLGRLDADGYLYLTGRKKDLLVTSGGRNVSPAPIESALRAEKAVIDVVLVGDGRPYITAVIVVEAPDSESVALSMMQLVNRVNLTLTDPERIRRFVLVCAEDFESAEIRTHLGKLKRNEVHVHLKTIIDGLYDDEPGPAVLGV